MCVWTKKKCVQTVLPTQRKFDFSWLKSETGNWPNSWVDSQNCNSGIGIGMAIPIKKNQWITFFMLIGFIFNILRSRADFNFVSGY